MSRKAADTTKDPASAGSSSCASKLLRCGCGGAGARSSSRRTIAGTGRAWRRRRSAYRSRNAGLDVVGLHDGGSDVGRLGGPQDRALLGADVHDERIAIRLRVALQDFIYLLRELLVDFTGFGLEVILRIFSTALKQLFLVVDGFGLGGTGLVAELIALRLEGVLQRLDLIALRLQLGLLGIELSFELREIALTFVCAANRTLESNNGNLGWTGGRSRSGGG